MSTSKRVSTEASGNLGHNPFGALEGLSLASGPSAQSAPLAPEPGPPHVSKVETKPAKSRGRVDILREKAGRGGKTVTVACGFAGIGLPEKEQLAKRMQKACGVGGTVKEGRIEIQGDKRDEVARILREAGFTPVFAGG